MVIPGNKEKEKKQFGMAMHGTGGSGEFFTSGKKRHATSFICYKKAGLSNFQEMCLS